MKITGLKTFICDAFRMNYVFVKVETDAGIHGVGEATLEMSERTVAAAVMELERYLIGRDPFAIEAIWHDLYRAPYWRGGPVFMTALAGVDMALWDIKGKALGVPVYELLGGKTRDRVPCYANGWYVGAKTPTDFADKAKIVAEHGFKGLKWDPFGSSYRDISRAELSAAMAKVEAVAAAVGDRLWIIIEGHGRFSVPSALMVARELARFNIYWFEEPILPDNLQALAELKPRLPVPVAAGERCYSRYEYETFLRLGCADYIQPDIAHVGGLTEARKICDMAEAHHVSVCPHNPIGPINNAASLHLAAALPAVHLLETMLTDVPYRTQICTEDLVLEDGCMLVPDRPGLGLDLVEDEIAKYPYRDYFLRHYTGNVTEIRPANATPFYRRS